MKCRILILSALIFMLSYSFVFAKETIVLTTLEWEPYIGQHLPNQGFVYQLVTEAFKREGYNVKIEYYPWARTVKMADDGNVDGYFPEYYADSRKEFVLFSDPFDGGPVGFFKLKSNNIKWLKLEDLKHYTIGVVRDYVNEDSFDAADYLKKDEANDDETNFRKLIGKRLDLIVADRYVGEYILKTKMPASLNDVEFVSPPLIEHKLYVCISKKTRNAQEKISAFNRGLESMKKDGTYQKILSDNNIKY